MSNDLISRQATIKTLHDEILKRRLNSDVNDGRLDEFDTETILRALPPAQQWIPVTERLPERNGVYLVTVVDFGNEWRLVDDAGYINGEWYAFSGKVYSEWHKGFCIVAWLQQPEPYKEAAR